MTESNPAGRIDLRAVFEPADPQQVDRVIGNVLHYVAANDLIRGDDILARIGRNAAPLIAAAAIVLCCATAILHWTDQRNGVTPVTSVAAWAESRRVPTNGELLASFEGYGR